MVASANTVTLIDPQRLSELDAARHLSTHVEEYHLDDSVHGMAIHWKILIGLSILAVVGVIIWSTGVLSRLWIRGKIYSGFAVVLILAVLNGVGGFWLLQTVNSSGPFAQATLELDRQVNELNTLQYEFILYGIEDKKHGEQILAEHKKIHDEFIVKLQEVASMELAGPETKALSKVEVLIHAYDENFIEVTTKYHEIEMLKDLLDKEGADVELKLEHLLHEHEADLDAMGKAGVVGATLSAQTHFVELLAECIILELKLSHEEVEFLLDKHVDRVITMGNELGALKAMLKDVDSQIATVAKNRTAR